MCQNYENWLRVDKRSAVKSGSVFWPTLDTTVLIPMIIKLSVGKDWTEWTYVSPTRADYAGSLATVAAIRVIGRTTGMHRVRRSTAEVATRRGWITLSRVNRTQFPRSNNRWWTIRLYNTGTTSGVYYTRQHSYRKEDRGMRPKYGCT